VTDGPFVEAKRSLAVLIVAAESYEQALQVARRAWQVSPGSSIEIGRLRAPDDTGLGRRISSGRIWPVWCDAERKAGAQAYQLWKTRFNSALNAALTTGRPRACPTILAPGSTASRTTGWYRLQQQAAAATARERHLEATFGRPATASPLFAGEVRDDMLRMLFVCCATRFRVSRARLRLKTLCGLQHL